MAKLQYRELREDPIGSTMPYWREETLYNYWLAESPRGTTASARRFWSSWLKGEMINAEIDITTLNVVSRCFNIFNQPPPRDTMKTKPELGKHHAKRISSSRAAIFCDLCPEDVWTPQSEEEMRWEKWGWKSRISIVMFCVMLDRVRAGTFGHFLVIVIRFEGGYCRLGLSTLNTKNLCVLIDLKLCTRKTLCNRN